MPARCKTKTGKPAMPSMANLTNGERLIVARRRARLTQEKMRERLSLTRRQYQSLEKDPAHKDWATLIVKSKKMGALLRSVERLEPHEVCHLARLRAGLTLPELGAQVGYAKFWVMTMERGGHRPDVLLDYWTRKLS